MASECKDIEKLGLFYKKNIFFKKVVFENFPKNSASIEKLHLSFHRRNGHLISKIRSVYVWFHELFFSFVLF